MKATPYDDNVTELAHELGLSLNTARDRFIWMALQHGDVGPLVCFFVLGYVPALWLRQQLAMMLMPEAGLPETAKKELRFRLEIRARARRRGPRRSKFEIALRDRRLAKHVANLMNKIGPGSYLAAIKQVAEETGWGEQTVRDAYDKRHGKKSRN
jgi:hypothetical protein